MLTPTEIYDNLDQLVVDRPTGGAFGLALMEAVGAPRTTITKLRDQAETGTFTWTRMLRFKATDPGQVDAMLEHMIAEVEAGPKSKRPRILFTYDGEHVAVRDTKLNDNLKASLDGLAIDGEILFPLGGHERYVPPKERLADVRATKHISRFHDAVRDANPDWTTDADRHALNLFMARVLFCLFSDDVGIFIPADIFENALRGNTRADGSDLAEFLDGAFNHMNTPPQARSAATRGWSKLAFVNGGLFQETSRMPKLDGRCRKHLLDCARLNWRTINPDIFGSMLQAVVDVDKRGELGMHYTSPANIMKVLGPILLDPLRAELERAKSNKAKLRVFLERLGRIRVFDPACGSGNFLIIAYKEMRALEIEALTRMAEARLSAIELDQFFGIEIDDFACQAARLGLWIAKYQCDQQLELDLGQRTDFLPLSDAGYIVCNNSARIDWLEVCPSDDEVETVVVGNPQFKGSTWQTKSQKADMEHVFKGILRKWGELDYVAIWFLKATLYAEATGSPFAFVATNSIVQGVQVAALWPRLLERLEIQFAHRSFKWANLAKYNAGVTCVITGLGVPNPGLKRLFDGETVRDAQVIGPYLAPGTTAIVTKSTKPSAPDFEPMTFGNKPTDGGYLILSTDERRALLGNHPEVAHLVRRLYGSQELMKGIERWCLWVRPEDVDAAYAVPSLAERFAAVRAKRLKSTDIAAHKMAETPWSFREQNEARSHTIMVPAITSENRIWLPVVVVDATSVPNNKIYAIFDGAIWQGAILSSRLHRLWLETVGGRLKEDPSYSNQLVWNTFPLPKLSDRRKADLEEHWWEIDLARKEAGFGRSLGDLYKPDTMPISLRRAHEELDETMETIFGARRYRSDADRIEHMLQLYERMIAKEAETAEKPKPKRRRKTVDSADLGETA